MNNDRRASQNLQSQVVPGDYMQKTSQGFNLRGTTADTRNRLPEVNKTQKGISDIGGLDMDGLRQNSVTEVKDARMPDSKNQIQNDLKIVETTSMPVIEQTPNVNVIDAARGDSALGRS